MENFVIRAANLDDAETISKVQRQSWQETYKNILPETYLNTLPLRTDMWKQVISSPVPGKFAEVLVSPEGEIAGFVSGGKSRPGPLNTGGEIYALYLLKQFQGKGLGKQLFLQAVKKLNQGGHQSFCLFVLTQNPTIGFYRKFKPDMEVAAKFQLEGKEYDETGLGWSYIKTLY